MRPRTLTIAVSPVLTGSGLALADIGHVDPVVALAALIGAVAIQAGTNLYNDVADFLKGGDQPMRQGPARVTAQGWASPGQVKLAASVCFVLAVLSGMLLVHAGGWPILALGLTSLLTGWSYSFGPRPIAYTPLGEIFVVAFFGLGAVGGSYYLQTQTLTGPVVSVSLALGLIGAGVLMANNYRDLEPDRLVGRRTLAIMIGPKRSKILYGLFLFVPIALAVPPLGPNGGALAFVLLPFAILLSMQFASSARGPAFNALLAATAKYQFAYAALIVLAANTWR
ncbi:MAG: 1,4-dihydroxy-2-naphthoate octaprenyltransferase [Rhodospirillales bacterium]|nr:1,4-dihydroxy-2-naphthoate octaprenyltransferase [Rhodospirillales bacterium]